MGYVCLLAIVFSPGSNCTRRQYNPYNTIYKQSLKRLHDVDKNNWSELKTQFHQEIHSLNSDIDGYRIKISQLEQLVSEQSKEFDEIKAEYKVSEQMNLDQHRRLNSTV